MRGFTRKNGKYVRNTMSRTQRRAGTKNKIRNKGKR